jgi:hypothetical protein
MSVRRQIYLAEDDAQALEEESRRTGLSVSELVRRAVKQCYGKRRRLTWQEVFTPRLKVNSAKTDDWVYDRLFDDEWVAGERVV